MTRDYRMDNLRCLLIYLVVFCHLMVEVSAGPTTGVLYRIIYVFHMPAFVFVTGYFARFRPSRVVWSLAVPYATFQLLATARRNLVAGRAWSTGLTLLDPQWTLWYLLACIFWYLTIPLLDRADTRRTRTAVVAGTFATSLAVGFVPWIGHTLDLSRVVVLYPFFCAGHFAGRVRLSQRIADERIPAYVLPTTALVALAATLAYLLDGYPAALLYRDSAYAIPWDLQGRTLTQIAATAWCVVLLVAVPARRIGGISTVGSHTMSVYLLHPWLIRVLRHALPLPGGEAPHLLTCALLAAGMLALLGNNTVGGTFAYVFGGGWVKQRQARG